MVAAAGTEVTRVTPKYWPCDQQQLRAFLRDAFARTASKVEQVRALQNMSRVGKGVISALFVCAVVCGIAARSRAQKSPADPDDQHPAQAFYLKLRSVGLNKSQVYKIR